MKDCTPLAGEMSGHMFFGAIGTASTTRCSRRRGSRYVAREGGPLSRRLADCRHVRDPELRVDCPDERKFAIVGRRRAISPRLSVATLDGRAHHVPEGWGLLRASTRAPCW